MRTKLVMVLALVVLSPAFAGCMGGEDASSGSSDEPQQQASVSTDAGGIEGLVTDAAVQAVANVTVTVEEVDEQTQTAQDGSFAFSEITPGSYTLTFEKEGFIPAERDIDVVAGDVTTIELTIAHEPSIQPYTQAFEWTGFIEASAGASWGVNDPVLGATGISYSPIGSGGDTTNHRDDFFFQLEPNAWEIVSEVSWEETNPTADNLWTLAEAEGFSNAFHVRFLSVTSTSPLLGYVNRTDLAEISENFQKICNGEMEPSSAGGHPSDQYCGHNPIEKGEDIILSVRPLASDTVGNDVPEGPCTPPAGPAQESCVGGYAGVGVAAQQDFTVFTTVFYNTPPACEDYSIVQDNRCDQLPQPPEDDPYEEVAGNFTPNTTNNSSGNESGS